MIPNEGKTILLNLMCSTDKKCVLFTNDVTETETNTLTDVTLATGTTAKTLTADSQTVTIESNVGVAAYPEQDFTITGAETYYGYLILNNAETEIEALVKFSAAEVFSGGADLQQLKITPKIKLQNPA